MGPIIVLILRLLCPFLLFRYPLFAGVFLMLLDGADVILIDAIGLGMFPTVDAAYNNNYHFIDKYLDMYYLTFAMFVSLRWKEQLARRTSSYLYLWRLIGFVLFEATKLRYVLFLAPNLFENFFLFYLVMKKINPQWKVRTKKRLLLFLVLLYIPKFGQEYILHVKQAQPWMWVKMHILS